MLQSQWLGKRSWEQGGGGMKNKMNLSKGHLCQGKGARPEQLGGQAAQGQGDLAIVMWETTGQGDAVRPRSVVALESDCVVCHPPPLIETRAPCCVQQCFWERPRHLSAHRRLAVSSVSHTSRFPDTEPVVGFQYNNLLFVL